MKSSHLARIFREAAQAADPMTPLVSDAAFDGSQSFVVGCSPIYPSESHERDKSIARVLYAISAAFQRAADEEETSHA